MIVNIILLKVIYLVTYIIVIIFNNVFVMCLWNSDSPIN